MPEINNNGVDIHFEIEGAGPPLIIQHGFTDSIVSWRDLGYVDALKENFRLLLIDARGHGQSSKPHDPEAYLADRLASDVTAVLDATNMAKAHFFGYSYGCRIGIAAAHHFPDRISSMVLGGMALWTSSNETDPFIEAMKQGATAIAGIWDAPVPAALRARLEKSDVEALIAVRRSRGLEPDLKELLPNVRMPCLVFAGDEDAYYPSILENYQRMPNAQFLPFAGLTHAGTFFSPDLILPHVQKFLMAQV